MFLQTQPYLNLMLISGFKLQCIYCEYRKDKLYKAFSWYIWINLYLGCFLRILMRWERWKQWEALRKQQAPVTKGDSLDTTTQLLSGLIKRLFKYAPTEWRLSEDHDGGEGQLLLHTLLSVCYHIRKYYEHTDYSIIYIISKLYRKSELVIREKQNLIGTFLNHIVR